MFCGPRRPLMFPSAPNVSLSFGTTQHTVSLGPSKKLLIITYQVSKLTFSSILLVESVSRERKEIPSVPVNKC